MQITRLTSSWHFVLALSFFLFGCDVSDPDEEKPEPVPKMTVNGNPYTEGVSVQVEKYNSHFRMYLVKSTFDFISIQTSDTLGGRYPFKFLVPGSADKAAFLYYNSGINAWIAGSGAFDLVKNEAGEISGNFEASGFSLNDTTSLTIKNGHFEARRSSFYDYSIDRTTLFKNDLPYGSVTDIDGNTYKTIQIGDQEWMAENLKVTRFNNGDSLYQAKSGQDWASHWASEMYCWPQFDTIFKETYGALYTWINVRQDICPAGWHVPTNEEWDVLNNYLIDNNKTFGFEGNRTAKALAANQGWQKYHETDAVGFHQSKNNKSGFAGLPAGKIWIVNNSASYSADRVYAFWWSRTESAERGRAFIRSLGYGGSLMVSYTEYMTNGMSIRCVKDKSLMVNNN
jgi:uncharacterized protein (TIGR02145 family)